MKKTIKVMILIIQGTFFLNLAFWLTDSAWYETSFTTSDWVTVNLTHESSNPEDTDYWVREATQNDRDSDTLFQAITNAANDHWVWTLTSDGATCSNWLVASIDDPDPEPTDPDPEPESNPEPTDLGGWPDPEPTDPEPIVTTSTSASFWCSSYISSRTTTWSSCAIEGWWSAWSINCRQTPSYSPNSSSCWTEHCTTTTTCDADGNNCSSSTSCTCDSSGCPSDAPQPNYPDNIANISIKLSTPSTVYANDFANNIDENIVKIWISWNTNQNRNIVWWLSKWYFSNFQDASNIPSNKIDGWWWDALNINYSTSISSVAPNSNILNIPVTSRTPLDISNGSISFDVWSKNFTINNINYKFLKPYIWWLHTDPNSFIIWNQQKLILTPQKVSWVSLSESNVKTHNLKNWLVADTTWYYIQYKTWENNSLPDWKSELEFILNYTWNDILWSASIKTDPYISYNLDGQYVKYYLSENTEPTDRYVKLHNWNYVWVNIIWLSQAVWKQDLTQQQVNFSNISTSEFRNKFKKETLQYTRWMEDGQKLNWVLYLNGWDYDYSSINKTNVKTIVIRNWNLTIDQNINNWMWIILLRDDYEDKTLWNIFVKKDVSYIKWYLYGDGWLISIRDNSIWFDNYEDSYDRTNALNKQLVLEGKLYTRNTVWWSIWTSWTYLIPWWKTTVSYEEALKYDINKFRLWNEGHSTNLNQWYDDYFVIIYKNIDGIKLFE